jgi:hypothetical protein
MNLGFGGLWQKIQCCATRCQIKHFYLLSCIKKFLSVFNFSFHLILEIPLSKYKYQLLDTCYYLHLIIISISKKTLQFTIIFYTVCANSYI